VVSCSSRARCAVRQPLSGAKRGPAVIARSCQPRAGQVRAGAPRGTRFGIRAVALGLGDFVPGHTPRSWSASTLGTRSLSRGDPVPAVRRRRQPPGTPTGALGCLQSRATTHCPDGGDAGFAPPVFDSSESTRGGSSSWSPRRRSYRGNEDFTAGRRSTGAGVWIDPPPRLWEKAGQFPSGPPVPLPTPPAGARLSHQAGPAHGGGVTRLGGSTDVGPPGIRGRRSPRSSWVSLVVVTRLARRPGGVDPDGATEADGYYIASSTAGHQHGHP
jgi:hypothetical protein